MLLPQILHNVLLARSTGIFRYSIGRFTGTIGGRVLAAFELERDREPDFETRLHELGYECYDESNNRRSGFFLAG